MYLYFWIFICSCIIIAEISGEHAAEIQCGLRNETLLEKQFFILGGHPAVPGESPWTVSLQLRIRDGYWFQFCGGTLIHPEWVLTAAHCLYHIPASDMNAIIGQVNVEDPVRLPVRNIYKHPDFCFNLRPKPELGLVRLQTPYKVDGSLVNTACLPPPNSDFSGQKCIVSGWGNTYNARSTNWLNVVDIPIVPDQVCDVLLSPQMFYDIPTMICAGYLEGGGDACTGDSGGPLVCKSDNGSYHIVGIVSRGRGCGLKDLPGVYTRVTYFLDWIASIMARDDPPNYEFEDFCEYPEEISRRIMPSNDHKNQQ